MSTLSKISKEHLNEFILAIKFLGILFDEAKFRIIVDATLKYISGDKAARNRLRIMQSLENQWYASLTTGVPDYSVYDNVYYLADTWVCWRKYSREYLKSLISPKAIQVLEPDGSVSYTMSIKDDMTDISRVADLGCGIGYTTAALKEIFGCDVVGTNIKDTKQYEICKMISRKSGFRLVDTLPQVGRADLVFASEYFEHFERPIEHLIEVIEHLSPRYILFANTFNAKSIGHFNTYKNLDSHYTGKEISRLFTQTLKDNGYHKVKTTCFNNRPNYYKKNGE